MHWRWTGGIDLTEFVLRRDAESFGLIDISTCGFVIPDQLYLDKIRRITESTFELKEINQEEGRSWYYFTKKETATTEHSTQMELASLLGTRGFNLSISRIDDSRTGEARNFPRSSKWSVEVIR